MTVFRVIPMGDLVLGDPDPITNLCKVVMIEGPEYVRQTIQTKLKFVAGEWFRDLREGVPYDQDVFIANPDLDRIRTIFRQAILSVQEVQNITKLTMVFDRVRRTLAIEFDVQLVAGGVLSVRQPDPPFIISLPKAA